MCNLGHGVLFKNFVKGNNGTIICSGLGEFIKFLRLELKKAGRCGGLCDNIVAAFEQHSATSTLEAL